MRHNSPYMSSDSSSQSRASEAIYQQRELQQVRHAEERALLAQDHLRIRRNEVGPLWRNGTHGLAIDPQEEASPIAGVPLAHAHQLLSAQRVKRMGDAHKARRCDRSIRILD